MKKRKYEKTKEKEVTVQSETDISDIFVFNILPLVFPTISSLTVK